MTELKWGSVKSYFYELKTGVRQGGVLSSFLFGIFIGDLVKLVNKVNVGCKMGTSCAAIFLYADDVILLAPSVHALLQLLVNICDCKLKFLDMAINARKSSRMRFGPRHKSACADVSVSGFVISWTTSSRYLGVYLETSLIHS